MSDEEKEVIDGDQKPEEFVAPEFEKGIVKETEQFQYLQEKEMAIDIVGRERYQKSIHELREMGPKEYQRRCIDLAAKIVEIIIDNLHKNKKAMELAKNDHTGSYRWLEESRKLMPDYFSTAKQFESEYEPLEEFPEDQTEIIMFNMEHFVRTRDEDTEGYWKNNGETGTTTTFQYNTGAIDIAILGKEKSTGKIKAFTAKRGALCEIRDGLSNEDREFYELLKNKHEIEAGVIGDFQKMRDRVNELGIDTEKLKIFEVEKAEE